MPVCDCYLTLSPLLPPPRPLFSSPLSLSPDLGGGGGGGDGVVHRSPGSRTLLWAPSDPEADLSALAEAVNASSGIKCPKHVNHTEARRWVLEMAGDVGSAAV